MGLNNLAGLLRSRRWTRLTSILLVLTLGVVWFDARGREADDRPSLGAA